jgi:hypothetical protein
MQTRRRAPRSEAVILGLSMSDALLGLAALVCAVLLFIVVGWLVTWFVSHRD